jgi:hypothetical protein
MQTQETIHHEQQVPYHTVSRVSTTQKAVTIRETTAVKQSNKEKVKEKNYDILKTTGKNN